MHVSGWQCDDDDDDYDDDDDADDDDDDVCVCVSLSMCVTLQHLRLAMGKLDRFLELLDLLSSEPLRYLQR